jgi:hypothetical protein
MSTIVPITITASPLPSNFTGTPQQFMDSMVARLNVVTAVDSVSIVSQGSVPPTSNVGPWLKNGNTWYVWSTSSGSYVPVNAEFPTLKYVASITAPDWRIYTFWIQLNPAGTQAIGIAYWDAPNIQWRNVYDSTFLAFQEQIGVAVTLYPCRGDGDIDVDAVFAGPGPSTINPTFNLAETFDASSIFGGSTITVPVGGYFRFDAKAAFECIAGTPTDNAIIFGLARNGTPMLNDAYTAPIVDGVTGVRNYSFSTLVNVNPSDQFTLYASITCTGAATWRIKKEGTYLAASRVNATL